jgi:hypothetical protein
MAVPPFIRCGGYERLLALTSVRREGFVDGDEAPSTGRPNDAGITWEVVAVSTLAEFGTGQVLWSIIWFTLFFIWIWILLTVFADIFRSHDLGGFAKTIWIIFVIVLPYLGVFVYLIARGKGMQERNIAAMAAAQQAQAQYIQSVAGTAASPAEEVARLSDLRDKGAISEEEFQAAKAKVLAS